jgi:hypothetical protein
MWRYDNQLNDIQDNDTQHIGFNYDTQHKRTFRKTALNTMMFSTLTLSFMLCHFYCYEECRKTECHGAPS